MMAPRFSRRRFLAVAAAACTATQVRAKAPVATWRGPALGALAEVRIAGLDGAEAAPILAQVEAELARIDRLFSLYRGDSALVRLNRNGVLPGPEPDFLHLLSLARTVHFATEGAFDPTVQPLFALHAEHAAAGRSVDPELLSDARSRVSFERVRFDGTSVHFERPGMAMTLNGIAQGYATDRLTDLLQRAGLRDVLVNAGEIRAVGSEQGARGWPVRLPGGQRCRLENRALATSDLFGTIVDPARAVGHIFAPSQGTRTLRHGPVTAYHESAAVADAASTAAVVLDDRQLSLLGPLGVRLQPSG
ncbi:FAD:protein FMN transferase [Tropicimonas sediminicola]|uniref:FAD:protein FMN transferase n=1 Tax=Tropicimonas sediminicola TaxID=1031541 RepID=A0A239M9G1_9RHOB|nr:FAD:protein FMN transferase [Tropicimonas sediminicola]SNT39375.1 thiamine biosynthesis lipoprotein [Tropicimonas sediminicola]